MPEKLIGIKAVIFDHDDTLVSTMKPKWEQHKFVASEHYGKILTDEELRQHWGKPFSEMIRHIYGTDDIEGARANIALHRHKYPKVLFEGVLEALGGLRNGGRLTGLVTANSREGLGFDLTELGISKDLFDHLQTEEDTLVHKPDPKVFDPIKDVLLAQQILPGQVVYIGDGIVDMQAAMGAGFQFIGVETGMYTSSDFTREGALSVLTVNHAINLIHQA